MSNYSKYFLIDGPKITMIEQFKDFHQVVSKEPLSLKTRSIVGIRINNCTKNNIYFGILKDERKK